MSVWTQTAPWIREWSLHRPQANFLSLFEVFTYSVCVLYLLWMKRAPQPHRWIIVLIVMCRPLKTVKTFIDMSGQSFEVCESWTFIWIRGVTSKHGGVCSLRGNRRGNTCIFFFFLHVWHEADRIYGCASTVHPTCRGCCVLATMCGMSVWIQWNIPRVSLTHSRGMSEGRASLLISRQHSSAATRGIPLMFLQWESHL